MGGGEKREVGRVRGKVGDKRRGDGGRRNVGLRKEKHGQLRKTIIQ